MPPKAKEPSNLGFCSDSTPKRVTEEEKKRKFSKKEEMDDKENKREDMEIQLHYSKLFDKYTKLKRRKESEMEQYNREQEKKFMNYVSAAEEMIEHLKATNERLQARVNELRDQVSSKRSAEYQYAEYQKLLVEEKQKTKDLLGEVERLHNQLHERENYRDKNKKSADRRIKSPSKNYHLISSDLSNGSGGERTLRLCSICQTEEPVVIQNAGTQEEHLIVKVLERNPSNGTSTDRTAGNTQQVDDGRISTAISGGDVSSIGHASCHFQTLLEHLVGMQFSTVNQTEGLCLSVLHQSSGYSFSLTWVENTAGEEPELLYHVLSLGTFERVAPEWMREDLMFTMSMCAVFFDRVLRITRLHC